MTWLAVVLGVAGCYAFKLAGVSVPRTVLAGRRVSRVAEVVPIALLAGLVAIQTFSAGARLGLDARAAGIAVAIVAAVLRAPFLVVVAVAVAVTALVRLLQ